MSSVRLIAASFTPFREDGSIEYSAIEQQVQSLVEDAVESVFVCGTTGEGPSLSTVERMEMVARWAAAATGKLDIIVHVGHTSLVEAQRLAAHAEQAGAIAIAAVAPFYFRPSSAVELVDFCEAVASAAPKTPFFYYHIPSQSHVDVPMGSFFALAPERIPTLAGVKFTDPDLLEYGHCLELAQGRYTIHFGCDELLLSAVLLGARSAIGSTYCFAAPVYHRMIQAFDDGDLETATALQVTVQRMVRIAISFGGLNALKAMTGMYGPGSGPCREPLASLGEDAVARLRQALDGAGFTEELRLSRAWLKDASRDRLVSQHGTASASPGAESDDPLPRGLGEQRPVR